jgi:hypothetical protein
VPTAPGVGHSKMGGNLAIWDLTGPSIREESRISSDLIHPFPPEQGDIREKRPGSSHSRKTKVIRIGSTIGVVGGAPMKLPRDRALLNEGGWNTSLVNQIRHAGNKGETSATVLGLRKVRQACCAIRRSAATVSRSSTALWTGLPYCDISCSRHK